MAQESDTTKYLFYYLETLREGKEELAASIKISFLETMWDPRELKDFTLSCEGAEVLDSAAKQVKKDVGPGARKRAYERFLKYTTK